MSNNKRKRPNWRKKEPSKTTIDDKDMIYSITPRFDYIGYNYYFIEKELDKAKDILQKVLTFESFIQQHSSQFNFMKIIEQQYFTLNIPDAFKDKQLLKEWTTLNEDLVNHSETTVNIFALAMHQICFKLLQANGEDAEICIIHCRLQNFVPIMQIKHLRASTYGKLVTVKGTIIKTSLIDQKCTQMEFKCEFCNGTQVVIFEDGLYIEPNKCQTKGCSAKANFEAILTSDNTLTVPSQSLKLLELVGEESDDNARMPRTLECEVCDDLVGKCTSGDDVILTGVLTIKNANETKSSSKGKIHQSVYELFLKVNNVENLEKSREALQSTVNLKDSELIKKIKEEPKLFRFLVQSLCPKIYGHEIVKAGLLLALFGGTKTEATRRSDSHVLIVGDPGLGKSQMLLACYKVAPRGVFVGASTTTNSGLTVTMCKESSGEYRLEAGAMVLADQGCCCLDEFDNMSAEHACLLEVMEQQHISIAKAGVVCSVPTRASVIAAANPVSGHYNKSKTVSENLKMKSPLLSRFDLVFIILDKPDEKRDAMLGEHVLCWQSNNADLSSLDFQYEEKNVVDDLRTKLTLKKGEKLDHLPAVLFKKYIAHANKCIYPKLSQEAAEIIKHFYVDLRRQYHRGDSIPVTARQLESLVRLTQARAKLELREIATAEDAQDVVDIMKNSLLDVFTDDLGVLDFTRTQNGAGMSNHKSAMKLLKTMQKYADKSQRYTYDTSELRKWAASIGIGGETFYNLLDSMNLKGYLLKKGSDRYQLIIRE